MPQRSAGLVLYRRVEGVVEVFLVHPGGPFWAKKDLAAWSIPKGEIADGEAPLAAAQREFQEETGCVAAGDYVPLAPVRLSSGKVIHAWAVAGDCDPSRLRSTTFPMEWPPRSGQWRDFPEVDRAAWFPLSEARRRITPGQVGLIDQLATVVR